MKSIKLAVGSLALWLGCLYVPSVSAQDGKSNQSVGSYPPDEFSPKAKKYCSLLKKSTEPESQKLAKEMLKVLKQLK
ncbi:MAG: hypothetical protein ACKOI1_04215 [Bacteroidota bacterium]